jgi:hypothetical protein
MRTPKPDTYQTEHGMAVLCISRSGLTPLRYKLTTVCQPAQSEVTLTMTSAKPRGVIAVEPCFSERGQ